MAKETSPIPSGRRDADAPLLTAEQAGVARAINGNSHATFVIPTAARGPGWSQTYVPGSGHSAGYVSHWLPRSNILHPGGQYVVRLPAVPFDPQASRAVDAGSRYQALPTCDPEDYADEEPGVPYVPGERYRERRSMLDTENEMLVEGKGFGEFQMRHREAFELLPLTTSFGLR